LALFASRFYDQKKIDFNLPAERKKRKKERKKERKTADEENGLEPGRVLTLHLDPRFTCYSSAPYKPSCFRSIIFLKALTFQAVIGYFPIEVFSFCRIVFFIKKSLAQFLFTLKSNSTIYKFLLTIFYGLARFCSRAVK